MAGKRPSTLEHLKIWIDGGLRFSRFDPCLHGFVEVLQLERPHCGVSMHSGSWLFVVVWCYNAHGIVKECLHVVRFLLCRSPQAVCTHGRLISITSIFPVTTAPPYNPIVLCCCCLARTTRRPYPLVPLDVVSHPLTVSIKVHHPSFSPLALTPLTAPSYSPLVLCCCYLVRTTFHPRPLVPLDPPQNVPSCPVTISLPSLRPRHPHYHKHDDLYLELALCLSSPLYSQTLRRAENTFGLCVH